MIFVNEIREHSPLFRAGEKERSSVSFSSINFCHPARPIQALDWFELPSFW